MSSAATAQENAVAGGGVWYRYEAKGIQGYILATNRLKEIKGGSVLIEELGGLLEESLQEQGAGGEVVLAAAGGATVLFPNREAAEDFRAQWPLLVAAHAPGLQIVQGLASDTADAFPALQKALWRDRARIDADLPEACPLVQRAPRTGLPAVAPDPTLLEAAKSGETLFDAPTRARLLAGRTGREDLLGKRIWAGSSSDAARLAFIDDVDELGAEYVAVIHADGNDLGTHVRRIGSGPDSIDLLSAFSRGLSRATVDALRLAFETLYRDRIAAGRRAPETYPARPVVRGGDDLVVLIRGDLAIDCVRLYLEHFEQESRSIPSLSDGLTACAGIALVHPHYPFHLALDLAEGLCKYAKDQLRGVDEGPTPSALLFHRVTTSLTESYQDLIDGALAAPRAPESRRALTLGPYTLREIPGWPSLVALEALRNAADGLPRGGLRDVVYRMQRDVEGARDRLARLREVLTDAAPNGAGGERWQLFENALARLSCGEDGWSRVARQRSGPPVIGTPLLDALTWNRIDPRAEELE